MALQTLTRREFAALPMASKSGTVINRSEEPVIASKPAISKKKNYFEFYSYLAQNPWSVDEERSKQRDKFLPKVCSTVIAQRVTTFYWPLTFIYSCSLAAHCYMLAAYYYVLAACLTS